MKTAVMMVLALIATSPCAALDEEVRPLATRPDVTESFLLIRPATSPVPSVVLFPGALRGLRCEGTVKVGMRPHAFPRNDDNHWIADPHFLLSHTLLSPLAHADN
jgi:hypothetical protein